jgi:hypothetical protein
MDTKDPIPHALSPRHRTVVDSSHSVHEGGGEPAEANRINASRSGNELMNTGIQSRDN